MKKKILSILLVVCMVLTLVPPAAFADSGSHTVTICAGEGGMVSTDGTSWSDSVSVTVNEGGTLKDKVYCKADAGYDLDGVIPSQKIVSVATGFDHTVLLDANGNVWTAGSNEYDQLGRETPYDSDATFTQVDVGDGVKIKAIAAGCEHTVLLGEDGKVWTAGGNSSGQLGRKTSSDSDATFKQVTVGNGVQIKAIAAGGYHTVLLDEDGNVWTAGRNDYGQLGRDGDRSAFTQVDVGKGVKIKAIAAGGRYTVLLDAYDNVLTAGDNFFGQLGRDGDSSPFKPVTNGIDDVNITAIAAGGYHTVLLGEYGKVWTAGDNFYGQLGRETSSDSDTTFAQAPVIPNSLTDVITFDELISTPITSNAVWFVKFKDIQKPVITGLEDGKTYCDTVEFEVTDNGDVASVQAGDEELTPDTNGKYTLEKGKGNVTVVVIDNSGNTADVTVTVNDGHTYIAETKKRDALKTAGTCTTESVYYYSCEVCGEVEEDDSHTFTGDKDANHHTGELVWKTTETQHKQYYDCCNAVIVDADHTWSNGVCTECGYICVHKDADKDNTCDYCGERLSSGSSSSSSSGSSSGGGFSGVYNYPVRADSTDINGAAVTLDKSNAVAGDKVTITVTPDSGKAVDEVIVTDADGKTITVTKAGDNKYTFTMPAGKVNIAVTTKAADYQNKIVLQIGNRNILDNNRTITNDVAPVIVDNRTMVPIRVITETLGGTADWNADTQTVTLNNDGKTLTMTIGQTISGFDAAPIILNDRTYVPVRYVAEMLGAMVEWIGESKQIVITK